MKHTCGAVLALFSNILFAQAIPIPNADFEQSDGAGWAKGWDRLQHAGEIAYRFTLDGNKPFSGKASGKIERTAPQVFGLFKQRIDARRYAGKRVSVSVYAKAQDVGEGGGGLYVRVDGSGESILKTDASSGTTAGSHDWKPFRVVVEIPTNAVTLEFGIMLQDAGAIWADEFALAVTTDPITLKSTDLKPDDITFDSVDKNRTNRQEHRGKVRQQKP
jgi:hypothetical protein